MKKLLIIICVLLGVVSCGEQEEKSVTTATKVEIKNQAKTFNLGYLRVPNDTTVAKQMGYIDQFFKDKGVKVNYIVVDSGVQANNAFLSGSLDFATMGNANGIVALSRGLDTELVWIHEILGDNEALVVRNEANIKTIADLKGKKVATPFSSTAHYVLLKTLEDAGLKGEVQVLDMMTPDIVAAWQRGDIDAAYTWEPSKSKLVELDGSVLVSSADMVKKGIITANVGLARKKFADENPELMSGFLAQLQKASDLYRNSPEEASQAAAKELEITVENAKAQISGSLWLSPIVMMSKEYMGTAKAPGAFSDVMLNTSNFLQENHSIETVPTKEQLNTFINSTYINKVK